MKSHDNPHDQSLDQSHATHASPASPVNAADLPARSKRLDRRKKKGAALMMTLIMLVLLSILITGFVVSMRTELSASYSAENIQRTKMISQAAVSHGIELLRANIPDPAGIRETIGPDGDPNLAPPRNWISNPGRLVVDIDRPNEQIVDLHTGTQHDGDNITSFDLNTPLAGQTAAAIIEPPQGEEAAKMRVAWVNILKDPTAPAAETNPVIGRYAFWMDDESSKLNFNVASGKQANAWQWLEDDWLVPYTVMARGFDTSTAGTQTSFNQSFSLGHPKTVNFDMLFEGYGNDDPAVDFDRGRLHATVFHNGFHQYPEAITDYYDFDGDLETFDEEEKRWYDENKWNITFYNRSPEFNVFGKSRYFTTVLPLALEGGPAYQMPFAHEDVLHLHTLMGSFGRGDDDAVANRANLEQLRHYLHRTDWPGFSGSFADKYGGPEAAFQVALNIVAMGNMATGNFDDGNGNVHYHAVRAGQAISGTSRNDPTFTNGWRPERDIWRSTDDDNYGLAQDELFMAQMPGPHLTEVRFTFFVENPGAGHKDYFYRNRDGSVFETNGRRDRQYYIGFRYQVEYYMHPHGWIVPTVQGYVSAPDIDPLTGLPIPGTESVHRVNPDNNNAAVNGELSPFPTTFDLLRISVIPDDWSREGRVLPHFCGLRAGSWNNDWHREAVADIAHQGARDPYDPFARSSQVFTIAPKTPERVRLANYLGTNPHIRVGTSQKLYLRNPFYHPDFPTNGWWRERGGNYYYDLGLVSNSEATADPNWEKLARNSSRGTKLEGSPRSQDVPLYRRAAFRVREKQRTENEFGQVNNNDTHGEEVTINFLARLGLTAPNTSGNIGVNATNATADVGDDAPNQRLTRNAFWPKQMVPLGNTPTTGLHLEDNKPEPEHAFEHSIYFADIRSLPSTSFGWKIKVEPRMARDLDDWDFTTTSDLGRVDFPDSDDESKMSKFRHVQVGTRRNRGGSDNRIKRKTLTSHQWPNRGSRSYSESFRFMSPGYFSLIHTGQTEKKMRSLSLLPEDQEDSSYGQGPPDYVLFDLFAGTYPSDSDQWNDDWRLPDSWSAVSYMNSTAGQVNLNSRIYPDDSSDFNPPPRTKPLQAVFEHLRRNDQFAKDFVDEIEQYQTSRQWFDYVGELAEVKGYDPGPSETQFRREEILRNMMGCLTTKSNTFGMWGVAQSVQKTPRNLESDPSRFEAGDQVIGEKRFFALIERYIWPGRDGAPGNGEVDETGRWNSLAQPPFKTENQMSTGDFRGLLHDTPGSPPDQSSNNPGSANRLFAVMDGPDEVDMESPYDETWGSAGTGTSFLKNAMGDVPYNDENDNLEEAYNPPHAVVKYRVVYFKYLDQ